MSLVRAIKKDNQLIIVSDTKLSYSPNTVEHLREDEPITGVIKSVIISHELCICFAGEVAVAQKLYDYIDDVLPINDIIDKAYEVHKISYDNENCTDFIISYYDDRLHLIEVKDLKVQEVENSWIGDIEAFNKFQEVYFRNEENIEEHPGVLFSIKRLPDDYDEVQTSNYNKMFNAMKIVIDESSINSVGGFVVPVVFENFKFKYSLYFNIYRKPLQDDELDGAVSFGSTELGSHSVNFYSSDKSVVAVHWNFGKLGIVYSADEFGMLRPSYYTNVDEIDFEYIMESNYKITPGGSIQTNAFLYYQKGNTINKKDLVRSNWLFNRGIESLALQIGRKNDVEVDSLIMFMNLNPEVHEIDLMKVCQYNYGVTFYYLGDYESAKNSFGRALYIDSSYIDAYQALETVCKIIDSSC